MRYRRIAGGLGAIAAAVSLVACRGRDPGEFSSDPAALESTTGPLTSDANPTSESVPSSAGSRPITSPPGSASRTRSTTPSTSVVGPAPTAGQADFTVDYPPGWDRSGQVQATAFAAGARACGSALIVDWSPPPDSGQGATVQQSFVQMCWKDREAQTLDEFMVSTYGSSGDFQKTTLAARPAYVSRTETTATYFVDTSERRYQVVTSVTASDELKPTRLAEVDRIVRSLSLPG